MSVWPWMAGGAAVIGAAAIGVGVGGWLENRRLSVTYHEVALPSLPAAFEQYRVVHLSDLHATWFGEEQEKLVQAVLALSPDAVIITGDLIDRRRTHTDADMEPALVLLRRLSATVPTVRVDGNHEPMSKVGARFRELAAATNAVDATGRVVALTKDGQTLPVIGVPDVSTVEFDDERWARQLTALCAPYEGTPHLVLSHRPHFVRAYRALGATAVFSGHAHGGQWRLPLIGGLFAPDQGVLPRYTEGCHRLGDAQLIISRGLGNSGFPLRLFNPPEIGCITLTRIP